MFIQYKNACAAILAALVTRGSPSESEATAFRRALAKTPINLSAIESLCGRLQRVYDQSNENSSSTGPHLVRDEDDDEEDDLMLPVRVPLSSVVHAVSLDHLDEAASIRQEPERKRDQSTAFVVTEDLPPLKRTKNNLAEVV